MRRRVGNPKSSIWYSAPQEARHRKKFTCTLSPELLDLLDGMVPEFGESRSRVIETAVAELARQRRRRR